MHHGFLIIFYRRDNFIENWRIFVFNNNLKRFFDFYLNGESLIERILNSIIIIMMCQHFLCRYFNVIAMASKMFSIVEKYSGLSLSVAVSILGRLHRRGPWAITGIGGRAVRPSHGSNPVGGSYGKLGPLMSPVVTNPCAPMEGSTDTRPSTTAMAKTKRSITSLTSGPTHSSELMKKQTISMRNRSIENANARFRTKKMVEAALNTGVDAGMMPQSPIAMR
jgi:hypothetical protein